MSAFIFLCAALAAAPADSTVIVQKGESISQVAKRALGDEAAAEELRALNGLSSTAVAEGTVLKVPGPERQIALSALSAARRAIEGSSVKGEKRAQALSRWERAQQLFNKAEYKKSAVEADAAWKLVSDEVATTSEFSVHVEEDGKTTVQSQGGKPVRVDGAGVETSVYPGQKVSVGVGEAPRFEEPAKAKAPKSPTPLAPADGAQLLIKPKGRGLSPLVLSWSAIPFARFYEVELFSGSGRKQVWKANTNRAQLPVLPEGRYRWRVRAFSDGVFSEPSKEWTFDVVPGDFKLEARGSQWK
jgi:hypothetical protein